MRRSVLEVRSERIPPNFHFLSCAIHKCPVTPSLLTTPTSNTPTQRQCNITAHSVHLHFSKSHPASRPADERKRLRTCMHTCMHILPSYPQPRHHASPKIPTAHQQKQKLPPKKTSYICHIKTTQSPSPIPPSTIPIHHRPPCVKSPTHPLTNPSALIRSLPPSHHPPPNTPAQPQLAPPPPCKLPKRKPTAAVDSRGSEIYACWPAGRTAARGSKPRRRFSARGLCVVCGLVASAGV